MNPLPDICSKCNNEMYVILNGEPYCENHWVEHIEELKERVRKKELEK